MGKHKQAGFTVIELLVAIAVVGILVPTLSGFITDLNALNDRARDLTIVNSLAENKIESLRSQGFTSLSDGTTTFTTELPVTLGSPKSATYVVSTPHTGIKQINMTISYKDHGRTQTAQYTTYIGELGVGQY